MPRSFLIVDGSNFYHKLKELGLKDLLSFRWDLFTAFIATNTKLVKQTYYVGAIREETGNPKSQALMGNQMKLFSRLRNNNYKIALGYILKADGYHEKGVEYVGFSHKPSFALIKHCSTTRLLRKEDLVQFLFTKQVK